MTARSSLPNESNGSQGSSPLAFRSGFGAKAPGQPQSQPGGAVMRPFPRISPPTGDAPTKAAETWHVPGPSLQDLICLEVSPGGISRPGVLRPVVGRVQTSCLVGLWSRNTPPRPALLMSRSNSLAPEPQARTVGYTYPKWACFREMPQSAFHAGPWAGMQASGSDEDLSSAQAWAGG